MSVEKGMLLGLPERWDEACFAVPAVRALEKAGLVGGLVLRQEQAAFWKTVSGLPQFPYGAGTRVAALAASIAEGWEASLVWGEGLAAEVFFKMKIARRIGPGFPKLAKLLTHPLDVSEGAVEHRVRLYIKTCVELGVAVDRAEYFVAAPLGIPAEPKTMMLCPGSDYGVSHEWPLDRWQELAEELLERGRRITVAGAVGGRGLGKILAGRLGGEVEYFHASPLAAALPMLAAHQVVVAADGSLPHLAAHAGSTCVTLFGPGDAVWKRPLGKRHVVVKRHVECAPCLSPKCLLDGRCQTELEVGRVLAAIPKGF